MDSLVTAFTDPTALAALIALVVMEVVLGIDNLVFISILTNKLPEAQRPKARRIGIGLALAIGYGFEASGAQMRFNRSAKLLVKVGGMCWVMTVGGQLAGNFCSTAINASTPPVEEPMATTLRPARYSLTGVGCGAAAASGRVAR